MTASPARTGAGGKPLGVSADADRAGRPADHAQGHGHSATIASAWRVGTFEKKINGGSAMAGTIKVAGWIKHPFALDERTYPFDLRRSGWCLTHLPTGYAARYIIGPRKLAMQIADELLAAANWNFTNPDEAGERADAVKAVMARHPSAFVRQGELTPAKNADAPDPSPNQDTPHD